MKIEGTTTKIELCNAVVEQELKLEATPAQVYAALTTDIGLWWDPGFVMGGPNTTDVILEPRPGGRWMEVWGSEGEGFLWGIIQRARKDRALTISVPEGVIWSGPGSISIDLEETEGGGTLLKLRHVSVQVYETEDATGGYIYGWSNLLGENLRKYLETGEKMGVRKE
jgi:uncharacterized protein YndB with AHSA1/START domain